MPSSNQIFADLSAQYGTSDWTQWSPYPQPFYDHIAYPAAGTQSLDFFAVPAGGLDPNAGQKFLTDTNMIVPRQLGMNYLFVFEIRLGIFLKAKNFQPNAIATDASLLYGDLKGMLSKWNELFERGTLIINVDSKNYGIIDRPFKRCPAGMGLNLCQTGSLAEAGPYGYIQNNPDDANIYNLAPSPFWIAPTQTLGISIQWFDGLSPVFTNLVAGASPALQLGIFLGGYMVRARQ